MTRREVAEMTTQAKALRIEAGDNNDPREEVVTKAETIDELFAEEDANIGPSFGRHEVTLIKPAKGWNAAIAHGVTVIKNDQIDPDKGETQSYVRLAFVDTATGAMLQLQSYEDANGDTKHFTRRLYGVNVEGLRKNINKQYAGAASAMKTSQMLDFIVDHPISVWLSWSIKYNQMQVDFFDREAWEREKKEKAKRGN